MPFGETVSLSELLEERDRAAREAGAAKGRLAQIEGRIAALVKAPVDAALTREGTNSGTVRFMVGNEVFKAVISKTVTWSSDALKEIACEISPVMAANLFKVTYAVPDAAFKLVLDPNLRARLIAARTIKYGDPKVTATDT